MSQRPNYILFWGCALLLGMGPSALGQNPPPAKKPVTGPPSPQSTHYPILLLAFGKDPDWSLRIGLKGPERLDRLGYPPIPLEPAEVTHEAGADSWTYHAKDSATGAAVAVHLTREACEDAPNEPLSAAPPPGAKFAFRASVDHAQIGNMKGCARIAAELFPKINNRPDEEDDADKDKPPAPTVTNFKLPTAVAYIDSQTRVVMKRGSVVHVVAPDGVPLAISHDGKQLLYRRLDPAKKTRTFLYDFSTGKSTEVSSAEVAEAFWSPDDTRIAFGRFADSRWELCTASVSSTDQAVPLYSSEILKVQGWADAHTVLVHDAQQVSWIGDDGQVQSTLSTADLFGEPLAVNSDDSIRIHPSNPDLLLVSSQKALPVAGTTKNPLLGSGIGFFLYEVRSKRRVSLSPPELAARHPEWSRDGLQVFFTGTDSSKRPATYRIFWDGTGLQKYASGTHLVIGQ
ncbi:MAG TPA: hypothetical protein VH110_00840 [Candidatus Acidoferrum sp.]|jgi:hypothetical protein|nr:hypothetical protein [Candidatus Acidoferrum sp.]